MPKPNQALAKEMSFAPLPPPFTISLGNQIGLRVSVIKNAVFKNDKLNKILEDINKLKDSANDKNLLVGVIAGLLNLSDIQKTIAASLTSTASGTVTSYVKHLTELPIRVRLSSLAYDTLDTLNHEMTDRLDKVKGTSHKGVTPFGFQPKLFSEIILSMIKIGEPIDKVTPWVNKLVKLYNDPVNFPSIQNLESYPKACLARYYYETAKKPLNVDNVNEWKSATNAAFTQIIAIHKSILSKTNKPKDSDIQQRFYGDHIVFLLKTNQIQEAEQSFKSYTKDKLLLADKAKDILSAIAVLERTPLLTKDEKQSLSTLKKDVHSFKSRSTVSASTKTTLKASFIEAADLSKQHEKGFSFVASLKINGLKLKEREVCEDSDLDPFSESDQSRPPSRISLTSSQPDKKPGLYRTTSTSSIGSAIG